MRQLEITVTASKDLEIISDYFLAKSVDVGDRFVKAFNRRCQQLAQFPYISKLDKNLRVPL